MDERRRNGLLGELFAARHMRALGYEIVSVNFRSRFGEIDLIAQDDTYICFVEVKTRAPAAIAQPMEAVGREKQRRIDATAALYLEKYPTVLQPRYDVLEVFLEPNGRQARLHLIENAYESEY